MKFKNCVAVAFGALLFASCGENSSKTTGNNDTTVVNANNDLNNPPGGDTTGNTNRMDNTAVNIPEPTRTAFQAKYPNATNVNWRRYERPYMDIDWSWAGWPELDTSAYQVTYTENGTEYNAWFDRNNNWIGTVSNLDGAALPDKVKDVINKSYSGYTVTSVSRENDKNRVAYEVKLEKGQDHAKLLIDENGRIMKKVVNEDGVKTKEKNQ